MWDVDYAITHMEQLAKYKPLWIEEPTNCDDIFGHAKISKALKKYGIGVATGECCHNRVMFKQFLISDAMDFCQIDSCRLGGVNEIIAVILLAAKFDTPVCPHSGGIGLCEYVSHLIMFDYVCASASLDNRMVEYADHLHEHMDSPVSVHGGHYFPPEMPGYAQLKNASLQKYEFPNGLGWK